MLEELLTLNVFHFTLVLVRVGVAVMFMPGFSSDYVNTNVRLFFALALTAVCTPAVSASLPAMPGSAIDLGALVVMETVTGLFISMFARFLLVALSLAGHSIGLASGLMMAQAFDPINSQQGSLVTRYLSEVLVLLMFVTGLHYLLIGAILNSYQTFPVGEIPDMADASAMLTGLIESGFRLGLQLASPFMVYSILFQSTIGIMGRLMPRLNILFVAMPGQILFALALLMASGTFLLRSLLGYVERGLMPLAGP